MRDAILGRSHSSRLVAAMASLLTRFGPLPLLALLYLIISSLFRVVLLLNDLDNLDLTPLLLGKIFAYGIFYDGVTVAYAAPPILFLVHLFPNRFSRFASFRWVRKLFVLASIYAMMFLCVAEWIFWKEFDTRFNFIAVDYLVYTREVLGNIRESYPIPMVMFLMFIASAAVFFPLREEFGREAVRRPAIGIRMIRLLPFILVSWLAFHYIDNSYAVISKQRVANDLARNGLYELFAAFRMNQLNYDRFYKTRPIEETMLALRQQLATPEAPMATKNPMDITRIVQKSGEEKRLNVIWVLMESMSAEFFTVFGNQERITPHLDQLAKESLFFTNLYATGTRSNRAIEAATLSIPPIPGHAIVNRENTAGLHSLGYLFAERGYETKFIYGGFGLFDNMGVYFEGNGFQVVDRSVFDTDEKEFATIWGVADEYLFKRAVREMDKSFAAGKPAFNIMLTTSNHRPYKYPDGRIDIPSEGGGRSGAVKYADYAVHQFLEQAKQRPWFDDTVFVFVADHVHSSAGKMDLPVDRYHIPLFIYAPKHIQPRQVDTLASQIDITPTLLGLLNFSYKTMFFGQDILHTPKEKERALISSYQKLGLYRDGRLTILAPQQKVSAYSVHGREMHPIPLVDEDVEAAITTYQGADYLYRNGLYVH